jgi:acyl transferase domain-containing protein/acyl carrier protein
VDWEGFDRPYARRRVPLPTYPFQRQRYWLEPDWRIGQGSAKPRKGGSLHPLLGTRLEVAESSSTYFSAWISRETPGYLQDHQLFGAVLVPGAGYVEMALSAAAALDMSPISLADVDFAQALTLNGDIPVQMQLVLSAPSESIRTFRILTQRDGEWTLHATGKILGNAVTEVSGTTDLSRLTANCPRLVAGEQFYGELERDGVIFGPVFGPAFRRLSRCWLGDGEAVSEIAAHPDTDAYCLHPTVIDACFQTIAATMKPDTDHLYIPGGVSAFRFFRKSAGPLWCHAIALRSQSTSESRHEIGDMRLFDEDGRLVAELTGFQVLRLDRRKLMGSDDQSWPNWLYELAWRQDDLDGAAGSLAGPNKILAVLKPELESLADPVARDKQRDIVHHLDRLGLGYILEALISLGWRCSPGDRFNVHRLADDWDIAIQHRRLFLRLFRILEEAEILVKEEEQWRLLGLPESIDIASELQHLRSRHPEVAPEVLMLERCGSRLADVLVDRCDALQLLFADGDADDAGRLYANSPMNGLVAQAVVASVATLPETKKLRILEVGAGTGGTTGSVLQELNREGVEYTFTDLSAVFLSQAQETFRDTGFIDYRLLNIEEQPATQGFESFRYDIVVAANVLHATRDLRKAVGNARSLLAPGGLLVLLEATSRLRLADLVFGLTEGWWHFTDLDLRPDHPLLSSLQWQELLMESGFDEVRVLATPDGYEDGLSVIVARAGVPNTTAKGGGNWLVFDDHTGIGTQLRTLLDAQDATVTVVGEQGVGQVIGHREGLNTSDRGRLKSLFDATLGTREPTQIVYFVPPHSEPLDDREDVVEECLDACMPLLNLVQTIAEMPRSAPVALRIVTRGAVATGAEQTVNPVHAAVWGMGGTIAAELPELTCKRVDLDPVSDDEDAAGVLREALSPVRDDQIAYRDRQRYVARLSRHVPAEEAISRPLTCRRDGSYLITGGLGGLGLLVAKLFAERGAGRLVLLGRSEPSAYAEEKIAQLRASGVDVDVVNGDVSHRETLEEEVFMHIDDTGQPLRGIVHAAGLLRDGLLERQTADDFEAVFAAKIGGAWNLHCLSQRADLDFLVLFSSASALLGSPAQAPHAAANWFMDTLSVLRARHGLPSISIDWGPWSDVGAAMGDKVELNLAQYGMGMINPEAGIAVSEYLMTNPATNVAVMPVDLRQLTARFPLGRGPVLFSELTEFFGDQAKAGGMDAGANLLEMLRNVTPEGRPGLLGGFMRERIAFVLGMEPETLGTSVALTSLGLDSLMALKLRTLIDQTFQVDVPVAQFLDGVSTEELVERLLHEVTSRFDTVSTGVEKGDVANTTATSSKAAQAEQEWIEGVL